MYTMMKDLLERCKRGGGQGRLWGGGSKLPDPNVPREHVHSFPLAAGRDFPEQCMEGQSMEGVVVGKDTPLGPRADWRGWTAIPWLSPGRVALLMARDHHRQRDSFQSHLNHSPSPPP